MEAVRGWVWIFSGIAQSTNLLDLPQKSTIRALFKAKSIDLKTYSPSSKNVIQ